MDNIDIWRNVRERERAVSTQETPTSWVTVKEIASPAHQPIRLLLVSSQRDHPVSK